MRLVIETQLKERHLSQGCYWVKRKLHMKKRKKIKLTNFIANWFKCSFISQVDHDKRTQYDAVKMGWKRTKAFVTRLYLHKFMHSCRLAF